MNLKMHIKITHKNLVKIPKMLNHEIKIKNVEL